MTVKVEVGSEVGSEQFPVITTLRGEGKKRDRRGRRGIRERKVKNGLWGEEKLGEYREKMESENVGSREDEGVDEMIAKLNEVTDRTREEVRPKGNGEAGRRGWWDEEYRKSKDGVKKCISKWSKGEMEKRECNRKRRERERMLSEKRQREKESYKEEVQKAVMEGRKWEVINKERGDRKRINEEIGIKKWDIF